MQYKAIYLERKIKHVAGDDIYLTFVIQNSEGTILTDLSSWTLKGELFNDANEIRMDSSYFTISDSKITLHIPNSDTTSLADDYGNTYTYKFELQGTYDNKIYTLLQREFDIKAEEIDY